MSGPESLVFFARYMIVAILCFAGPLAIYLLILYIVERKNRTQLRDLAVAQGWQYQGHLFMRLSGTDDAGDTWTLKLTNGELANYVWQTAVPATPSRALLINKEKGQLKPTGFSRLTLFPVGSPEIQRRYHMAANSAAFLENLLTPAVEQILLNWPQQTRQQRQMRISVKNGRLAIYINRDHTSETIAQLVELGLAMKQALTTPPNNSPV